MKGQDVDVRLKRILGWDDITRMVEQLAGKLEGQRFDAMLVVTRGGMVPAGLLSEALDIRNILVAGVQFQTDAGEPLTNAQFLQFPDTDLLDGKDILIIDDVWDSGRTAVEIRNRVVSSGGKPTFTVLHYKPASSLYPDEKPDVYAEATDDWIVYPWDAAH
jgi:hypoxanthine phosphoribosyltransferase